MNSNKRKSTEKVKDNKRQKKELKSIESLYDFILFIDSKKNYDIDKYIDFKKIVKIKPYLIELNNMIGMESIKNDIVNLIMYYLLKMNESNDFLHTVITGPPGCGKTSVSKILGKIYAGLGFLKEDKFITAKRSDFISGYLGQTVLKTKDFLETCKNGVLFIDEAYSMASEDSSKKAGDSFSKEALDYLNSFLSEHGHEFVCIIAGYKDDINNTFFKANDGLERRFCWRFNIDPYTPEELYEMFQKKIKDIKWKLESNSIDSSFFVKNKDMFEFSGGDIENFISKCKFEHTRRIFCKQLNKRRSITTKTLNKEDIENGMKKYRNHKMKNNKLPEQNSHMYL